MSTRPRAALLHGPGMRARLPQPRSGLGDADGDRASKFQHAVEDMDGGGDLALQPGGVFARSSGPMTCLYTNVNLAISARAPTASGEFSHGMAATCSGGGALLRFAGRKGAAMARSSQILREIDVKASNGMPALSVKSGTPRQRSAVTDISALHRPDTPWLYDKVRAWRRPNACQAPVRM
jgi:hypothetical protein